MEKFKLRDLRFVNWANAADIEDAPFFPKLFSFRFKFKDSKLVNWVNELEIDEVPFSPILLLEKSKLNYDRN